MTTHQSTTSKVTLFRDDYAQLFDIKAAIVLNQIQYWTHPVRCKNFKEGRYWMYNSVKEWHQHFPGISERTLRRILKSLENANVLISKKFNAWRRDQRKWYSINFEKLNEMLKTQKQASRGRRRTTEQDLSLNPPPPQDPQKDPEIDQKLLVSIPEKVADFLGSKQENGRNLNVAKMTQFTFGQNDSMSKVQKSTHKITSPTSPGQNTIPSTPPTPIQDSVREMVTIWNKNIEDRSDTPILPYWQRRSLQKAFKHSFQSSLELWTEYCQIIAHNSFLMGQGANQWKVSLDWALKPQNIQKVQEKRYTGQKDVTSNTRSSCFSLASVTGSDHWKNICQLLVEHLGHTTFQSWFEEAELANQQTLHPTLYLGSNFKKSWVRERFGHTIETSIKQILPHVQWLNFEGKK